MPGRYTKKLQLQKLNETLAARKKQQNEQDDDSECTNSLSDGDDDDGDSPEDNDNSRPLRSTLVSSRHDTHPALNQGLGQISNAERSTNLFPSSSFTVPLPLYVSDRTTPIVDPCRQRPSVQDDWMRNLNVYKSKYLKKTRKQKQREKKQKNGVYNNYLFDGAEHIATQDNSYFRDSYDYYYTGGNLNLLPYSASGEKSKMLALHVSGERLQQLNLSKVGEEAELWQPLRFPKMRTFQKSLLKLKTFG